MRPSSSGQDSVVSLPATPINWTSKKLQGREGCRLGIGGYRAIYEIEGETINVLVLDAGPRGDIYK